MTGPRTENRPAHKRGLSIHVPTPNATKTCFFTNKIVKSVCGWGERACRFSCLGGIPVSDQPPRPGPSRLAAPTDRQRRCANSSFARAASPLTFGTRPPPRCEPGHENSDIPPPSSLFFRACQPFSTPRPRARSLISHFHADHTQGLDTIAFPSPSDEIDDLERRRPLGEPPPVSRALPCGVTRRPLHPSIS